MCLSFSSGAVHVGANAGESLESKLTAISEDAAANVIADALLSTKKPLGVEA